MTAGRCHMTDDGREKTDGRCQTTKEGRRRKEEKMGRGEAPPGSRERVGATLHEVPKEAGGSLFFLLVEMSVGQMGEDT